MALSTEEIIKTLSQALLKKDSELDSKSTINGTSSDDYMFYDPSELKGKWYQEIVDSFFEGSVQKFRVARELRKIVQEASREEQYRNAIFYKLNEIQKYNDTFVAIMQTIIKQLMTEFSSKSNREQAIYETKKFLINSAWDRLEQSIVDYLLKSENLYTELQNLPPEKWNKKEIEEIFERLQLEQVILRPKYEGFFKFPFSMSVEQMRITGIIYSPEIYHCWGTNLSWALTHIQKGNTFLVRSDILKNKFRTSKYKEHEYSAFFKEICAALKAGYTLYAESGNICLRPTGLSLEYLQKCDVEVIYDTGLVHEINPSSYEIEKIFNDLTKKLGVSY